MAFFHTGWIGADWLEYKLHLFRRTALSPCCMANSKPPDTAKKTTQAQRAPSTPGEQLKPHNPTEQTALSSTSPLLQGSGTCKDESVVRDSK